MHSRRDTRHVQQNHDDIFGRLFIIHIIWSGAAQGSFPSHVHLIILVMCFFACLMFAACSSKLESHCIFMFDVPIATAEQSLLYISEHVLVRSIREPGQSML
jgi:hypothetical protein